MRNKLEAVLVASAIIMFAGGAWLVAQDAVRRITEHLDSHVKSIQESVEHNRQVIEWNKHRLDETREVVEYNKRKLEQLEKRWHEQSQ